MPHHPFVAPTFVAPTRRSFLCAVAGGWSATGHPAARASPAAVDERLGPHALYGWHAFDLTTQRVLGQHADLRLPMCSSFKWLLAAAVLARVDHGRERLDRPIAFGRTDSVFNSPTVDAALQAAGGERAELSVGRLCAATVTLSDSAAANLLLDTLGGPAGLTAWLRSQGDAVTRLDRRELELNRVPPGDERDTTSPAAMVRNLRHLLYGPGLARGSRERLLGWLLAAKPGATRMPSGLRSGWRIGHKTGTWRVDPGDGPDERNACGDVGVLLPPQGRAVLIAAYTAGSVRPQAEVDRWFAQCVSTVTGPQGFGHG